MTPNDSAFTDTLISRTVRERIVLVGVTSPHGTVAETEAGLDELALLVDTAGADVMERIMQRGRPPTRRLLGRGKAEELLSVCLAVDADTVVFDDDLSPAQQRNLEKILGRTAIDRTAVILDIFAQNARTPEGRAQVELAPCATGCRACAAEADRSASRPVASAPAAPVRPSSRSTDAAWFAG